MWKQLKIFPNKQKFRERDQDSMRRHTDSKGEGREHAWVQEKESREDLEDGGDTGETVQCTKSNSLPYKSV